MNPPNALPKLTIKRTYRYRIYPTKRQVEALESQLAFCCDLYNAALEQRRDWRRRGRRVTLYDQQRQLTELRATGNYPTDMNVKAQRDPLRRLDLAFMAFFRRTKAGEKPGYPRWRSRRRYDSLTWPWDNGAGLRDDRLYLQGIGCLKVNWHRLLPDEADLRTVTTRRSCGKWYVYFSLELEIPKPPASTRPIIGLDLGVTTFTALSTGELIAGPRAGKRAQQNTRRLQRTMARRKRTSHRRRKAVAALARAREREGNVRRDHRHKLTHHLVTHYGLIAVEDLPIRNMTRSAKGTIEAPGRNVRQKSGLNRVQLDQAWGDFLTMLQWKAEEAATTIIKVDPRFTSQACSACGVIDPQSRRSQADFICTACGLHDHADVNAAKNILRLGQSHQATTVGATHAVA